MKKDLCNLIKPPVLKKKDIVALVSPSWCGAGLVPHRFQNGLRNLSKLGFKTRIGEHTLDVTGYTAGSAKDRAKDVNDMFADRNVKAILCTVGGDHSNQLLPYLNWDVIKNNPKVFIGYSDATVLHIALNTKAGLVTFYGPSLLNQFAENPDIYEYTKRYFLKAVASNEPVGQVSASDRWTDEVLDWFDKKDLVRPRRLKKNKGYKWLKEGRAEGRLLGGCISSLMHLRGTGYWPSFKNCIFFWEIPEGNSIYTGEEVSTIDSYLTDLELSGVFSDIKGMIIGRPYQYTDKDISLLKSVVLEHTKKYSFPILCNADFGHTDPMITIPIGVKARLDSSKNEFFITEKAVI